jgi:homoserine dehydrogenase
VEYGRLQLLRRIGHLDVVELVLANGPDGVHVNTSDKGKQAEASGGVLVEIRASRADEGWALAQLAVVVGGVPVWQGVSLRRRQRV